MLAVTSPQRSPKPLTNPEGAKLIIEELKMDTSLQCGTHMDVGEGETSAHNIECEYCCSNCRFEDMVKVKPLAF